MSHRLIGLLLFLSLHCFLTAQDYGDVKFGKLSEADLSALPPAADSTAEAYVLYDKMDLQFRWLPEKGPTRWEYVHYRVKLLKPSAFDRADVSLHFNRTYQDLGSIRAVIHLPSGQSIKLSRRDFTWQKEGEDIETVKFTFPQVTVGAVIEYEYNLSTESITTPTPFTFQQSIPVRWSEYTASIPSYYNYVSLGSSGEYAVNEVEQHRRPWGPTFRNAQRDVNENVLHTDIRWAMREIPSFRQQPYTNNLQDYLPKVRLQLQEIRYPGEIIQPVFSNWELTAKELYERRDFGGQFTVRGNYNKMWTEAESEIMAGTTDRERIDAAYYYICRRLKSNNSLSWLGTETPDRLLSAGTGNSADLNLSLIALLREAGIDAKPLLVSVRNGGAPIEIYPILNQFNHLMVYTEVDGKPYLLDANGPSRPPGLPREVCLNHRGWVVDETAPRWVDIAVPQARQMVMATLRPGADGTTDVELQSRLTSYYAFTGRGRLHNLENPEDAPIADDVLRMFPDSRVVDREVSGDDDDPSQPLSVNLNMRVPAAQTFDDYIYLQPVIFPLLDEELDDVETRLYPVDFPFPWQQDYVANIMVPEGYTVDELPESIRMKSEDGGMSATYAIQENASGMINLTFRVSLDRTVYQATDYPMLRNMYSKIIELQQANIVFKRAK